MFQLPFNDRRPARNVSPVRKPLYKRWWFILLVIFLMVQTMGRIKHFKEQNQKFYWNDLVLSTQVPRPRSNKGKVVSDSDDSLYLHVYKTSEKEFKDYLKRCEKEGYTQEADRTTHSYTAYNEENYRLHVYYYDSGREMTIDLDAPMKMQTIVWPASGVATKLPVPGSDQGTVDWDTSKNFSAYIGNISLESYADYVQQCIAAGFNQNYDRDEEDYRAENAAGDKLTLRYCGGKVMSVDIRAAEEDASAEAAESKTVAEPEATPEPTAAPTPTPPPSPTPTPRPLAENEAAAPKAASEYKYEDYQTVQNELEKAGFENISYEILYDIVWGWTKEGEVARVSINGSTAFAEGDVFQKDDAVVITYHLKEEDDPNKPEEAEPTATPEPTPKAVYYSTNTADTVKNGSSGVYAYKKSGKFYDIYYIIDLDEEYVYYFCEGNGDATCDKVKIDSGTLNDVVIITYHDGDNTWQEGLHFRWANQPDHLIWEDHNHLTYDFYPTDLTDALALRRQKNIHDY